MQLWSWSNIIYDVPGTISDCARVNVALAQHCFNASIRHKGCLIQLPNSNVKNNTTAGSKQPRRCRETLTQNCPCSISTQTLSKNTLREKKNPNVYKVYNSHSQENHFEEKPDFSCLHSNKNVASPPVLAFQYGDASARVSEASAAICCRSTTSLAAPLRQIGRGEGKKRSPPKDPL